MYQIGILQIVHGHRNKPMSGNPNMLELSIITYISILFLKPHLNYPGEWRVTQACFITQRKK